MMSKDFGGAFKDHELFRSFSFVCKLRLSVHLGLRMVVETRIYDCHILETVRASVVLSFNMEMILCVMVIIAKHECIAV